ncbi:hypothetical protein HIM_02983 [Hirsutella minnesotensis 3608]|nr:hypothetical protein HIM_02983 [Hirsutella minnesotensis 3608]
MPWGRDGVAPAVSSSISSSISSSTSSSSLATSSRLSTATATWLESGALSLTAAASRRTSEAAHDYDEHQLQALRLTSLIIASVSLISTLFATFWFVRMSRSFRHDLIILLIQSDALKSILFVILPAVELIRGGVASESTMCQVSGFFLHVGIEACDMAVVLVALHTALYIFRGRGGLYPYRRPAYAVFVLLPLTLASVAFVNKPAFTNVGRYCHLPVKPHWARLALSWVPRYFVLAIICGTYISTYVYVQVLMNRFGNEAGMPDDEVRPPVEADAHSGDIQRGISRPPHPLEASYSLAPPMPPYDASRHTDWSKHRPRMLSTVSPRPTSELDSDDGTRWHDCPRQGQMSLSPKDAAVRPTGRLDLNFKLPSYVLQGRCALSNLELSMPAGFQRLEERRAASAKSTPERPVSPTPSWKSAWPWGRRSGHAPRPLWTLPLPAVQSTTTAEPASPLPFLDAQASLRRGHRSTDTMASALLSPTLCTAGMIKSRAKMRRQLRQLFIYPAVYIAVWFIPFVMHVAGDDDHSEPHMGLAAASLASLCLHGTADALVFSILEKPWRHPRKPRGSGGGTLFSGAGFGFGHGGGGGFAWGGGEAGGGRGFMRTWSVSWPARLSADGGTTSNAGRTRDEMLVDSRAARRRRRHEEIAERRAPRRSLGTSVRDWWDVRLESVDESADDDAQP